MDFDSPDVEKDFPGLYLSGSGGNRKKDDEDFSESDHEKISKKELLLGRRKDKKDKKDRGYAALDGESSPEDDLDTKSPSKSAKKSKAFKFPTKNKEKREKSREKEKIEVISKEKDGTVDGSGAAVSGTSIIGIVKDKSKKDKDKKDKDKKDKTKDKEKKDKKSKQSSVNEEMLELGEAQPIFGVSLGLSVERSRCHDNVNLPLVIRDCIDFLQEHGLYSEQLYKVDGVKIRLQQLKNLYNNRESIGTSDFDVPTACGLLKLYFKELPEPILTTDLSTRFEEAAALPSVTQQEEELSSLINQLPSCNRTLLVWMLLHLDSVIQYEKSNKMNAQTVAMLLSPTLQMSHRLLVTILCFTSTLFGDISLQKYVPPITSTSPNLPETPAEIVHELKKQDSLLNQIHSEMNAGFVSKKREEQLWEVQRIITQLKRKLRTFEKKPSDATQKSLDEVGENEMPIDLNVRKTKSSCSDDESLKTMTVLSTESTTNTETKTTPQATPDNSSAAIDEKPTKETASISEDLSQNLINIHESGLLILPENHPEFYNLLRLQLENLELTQWKGQLQARINAERSDIVRLKDLLKNNDALSVKMNNDHAYSTIESNADADEANNYEQIIAHYVKENALLEQKKTMLAREIFEENIELIQLQVDLTLQNFKI